MSIAWAISGKTEPMQETYVVRTLGCKANLYDSQLIEAELQSRGWKPYREGTRDCPPSLCIVNSCTVTDEADRQSRKLASRLSRENPLARVVVTGCGAEVDPERLADSKGIDYVIGNQDKPRMVDLILERLRQSRRQGQGEVLGGVVKYGELLSRHPMDREWPLPQGAFGLPPIQLEGHSGTTRAFVKIQEGCNSFCTYCIIPYGRGPSRSLHPREVVTHAQALVRSGVREIVITGTNIGDYGIDWGLEPGAALPELFERILNETALERLRVGSLDPVEITDGLISLMERNPRFCPHFHVSLQAAHPRILRLMKRKYRIEQARDRLERIARIPAGVGGAFVGMDVITGFPGETDEEFEAGFEELSRLPWSRLHVFPYSERAGTPATRLPGAVRQEIRVQRTRRLNELSLTRLQTHLQRVLIEAQTRGTALMDVLLEKSMARVSDSVMSAALEARLVAPGQTLSWANGYTANYLRVLMPISPNLDHESGTARNEIVSARPIIVAVDRAQGDAVMIAAPSPGVATI